MYIYIYVCLFMFECIVRCGVLCDDHLSTDVVVYHFAHATFCILHSHSSMEHPACLYVQVICCELVLLLNAERKQCLSIVCCWRSSCRC